MAKSKDCSFILTPLTFNDVRESDSFSIKSQTGTSDEFNPLVYCRTCATSDPCLVPIFKGEGLNHQLEKKIQKYLPIKVSQEDELPVQLCYHCASTLIAWDTMVIGCVEAEEKLKCIRNSVGNKSNLHIKVEDEEGDVDMSESGFDLTSNDFDSDDEPLITKKFPRKTSKRKGKQKKGMDPEKVIDQETVEADKIEPKRLSEEPGLSFSSYQRHFGVRNPFVVEIFGFQDSNSIQCKICKAFREIRSILPKGLACVECRPTNNSEKVNDKTFAAMEGQFANEDNSLSSCYFLGKQLATVEKSYNSPVVCEVCGKKLSSKFSLSKHKKMHMGEKTMICHICGTSFRHRSNLVRHLKYIHEGVREHCCVDCGKSYRSHAELEDHKNTHNFLMKIVCEECGRTFLTKSSFYSHKKGHQLTNSKKDLTRFSCGECGKTFTTKKSRNQHSLIHSGEKPIYCAVCSKRFRTKANLSQHAKTHSDVKPFACDHCSKRFARKDHLTIHTRYHTGEKPFVCNYCGRGFAQINDMKKHVKIHEKVVDN